MTVRKAESRTHFKESRVLAMATQDENLRQLSLLVVCFEALSSQLMHRWNFED